VLKGLPRNVNNAVETHGSASGMIQHAGGEEKKHVKSMYYTFFVWDCKLSSLPGILGMSQLLCFH
jgi:hypothetical protein